MPANFNPFTEVTSWTERRKHQRVAAIDCFFICIMMVN